MTPYYNAIIKGVSSIMVSFSSWNGLKMHANHYLLTDFLKNKLRFRDFIISDYEGLDRITSPPHANYSYSVQTGIHAGIDMVMIPYNYTEFINELTYQVQNNVIPVSRINDAVRRILRVKFTMGLFENPYADLSLVGEVGKKGHRDLAREAVRKSLILLKNGTPILKAIKNTVDPTTKVVYSENPEPDFVKYGGFSYAIVMVGELPYAETVGDSMNLTISAPGPSTINNVCGSVRCIVVIISGRPVVIEPYINMIDALVAAWLPGTEGQGVVDVLFGDYGFSGKLSRTWFRSVDQLPMNVGDLHYDLPIWIWVNN